jgi:hypothetical protein
MVFLVSCTRNNGTSKNVFLNVSNINIQHNIYQKDENKETPQINDIRAMLRTIGDGEINISAYDTAWVALVKKMDGEHAPQFPSSISWIIQNQLSDGSWGDQAFFLVHDRMISTLACVVALNSWNIHKDKCEKGTCHCLYLLLILFSINIFEVYPKGINFINCRVVFYSRKFMEARGQRVR